MKTTIFAFFVVLLIINTINARSLAVVADHLENNTLIVDGGSSKLYGIRLQNPTSEQTKLRITYDNEIAKINDYQDTYEIEPESSKALFFNVSAPKKIDKTKTYIVSYTVHELSSNAPGLPILLSINKNFKVKFAENPNKPKKDYSYFAIGAVILLAFIMIFRMKTKQKFGIKGKII